MDLEKLSDLTNNKNLSELPALQDQSMINNLKDLLSKVVPFQNIPGIVRFISGVWEEMTKNDGFVAQDYISQLAKSCFGEKIFNIDFSQTVEVVIPNLVKFFGVKEENQLMVTNVILMILKGDKNVFGSNS